MAARKLHTRSFVSVPFPVADGERIVRAAKLAGRPHTAFIRDAAVAQADRVIAKHEREKESKESAA